MIPHEVEVMDDGLRGHLPKRSRHGRDAGTATFSQSGGLFHLGGEGSDVLLNGVKQLLLGCVRCVDLSLDVES
jgi:hypothetical protein